MRSIWIRVAVMSAVVLAIGPLSAEDPVNSKQLNDILAELQKIRTLLETSQPHREMQAQPTILKFDVRNAPVLGSKDAPLTIVEFTDYECQFCRQFHRQTFRDLKEQYVDSGKVRIYMMDLPLDIHPNALRAAQAGRCAGEQGQFWTIHDQMQSDGEDLGIDKLLEYAKKSGLNIAEFRRCVESGKHKEPIQQSIRDANSKGVRGTPAFVIGKSTREGVEGELVMGAVPYGIFEQKLRGFTQKDDAGSPTVGASTEKIRTPNL